MFFSRIFSKCGFYMMEIILCLVKSKIHLMLIEVKGTTENRSQFAFIASISLCEVEKSHWERSRCLKGALTGDHQPQEVASVEAYYLFPDLHSGATFSPLSLPNACLCPHPPCLSVLLSLKGWQQNPACCTSEFLKKTNTLLTAVVLFSDAL